MSYGVTEDVLREFFLQNKVRVIKLVILKNERGQSKGQAIIEFASTQDSEFVVTKLNQSIIEGRPVSFSYQGAKPMQSS